MSLGLESLVIALSVGPSAPDHQERLARARTSLTSGDISGWAEARALYLDEGGTVVSGPWARLEDLAALLRCRPLPAWDPRQDEPVDRALRSALRLEEQRLRRFLVDEVHQGSELSLLANAAQRLHVAPTSERRILWPLEEERWPGERLAPLPLPSLCKAAVTASSDGSKERHRAEREALALLMNQVEQLPARLRARAAWTYLRAAERPKTPLPRSLLHRLWTSLRRGKTTPFNAGAQILLGRRLIDAPPAPAQMDIAMATIAIARNLDARLAYAARVLWVRSLASNWSAVGPAADWRGAGQSPPDPTVRAWLDNARARALIEGSDLDALDRFASQFAQARGNNIYDEQTLDMVLEAQLRRPPSDALTLIAGLGSKDPAAVRLRWMQLGRRAYDGRHLEFARFVFDRLWAEAKAEPEAPLDLVDILGMRARVALAQGDAASFADVLDKLLSSGARRPVHTRRAVVSLVQDSLSMLAEPSASLARPRFAARLLAALRDIQGYGPRSDARLVKASVTFSRWAGALSVGRQPLPPRPSRRRRVQSPQRLGTIEVERGRPDLPAPNPSLPSLVVDSFLVWEDRRGSIRIGLPPRIRALAVSGSKAAGVGETAGNRGGGGDRGTY